MTHCRLRLIFTPGKGLPPNQIVPHPFWMRLDGEVSVYVHRVLAYQAFVDGKIEI